MFSSEGGEEMVVARRRMIMRQKTKRNVKRKNLQHSLGRVSEIGAEEAEDKAQSGIIKHNMNSVLLCALLCPNREVLLSYMFSNNTALRSTYEPLYIRVVPVQRPSPSATVLAS